MLAGISEGTHMISKKIFALLSATDIEVKFLVFRLKITLRLFSSRQSGWIILYLESTSKSVCTCYRKHQPQMKHCPEESVFSQKIYIWQFWMGFHEKRTIILLQITGFTDITGHSIQNIITLGMGHFGYHSVFHLICNILVLGSIMGLFTWQNGVFSFANKSPFKLP